MDNRRWFADAVKPVAVLVTSMVAGPIFAGGVACGPSGSRAIAPGEGDDDPAAAHVPASAIGFGGAAGTESVAGQVGVGGAGGAPFTPGIAGSGGGLGAGAGAGGLTPGSPADAGAGPSPSPVPTPSPAPRDAAWYDAIGTPAPALVADAAPAIAAMPTSGLVGYWTFDEGAGTRARDSSPNGNHAELMAGATWGAGRRSGSSAVALGGSRYVRVPKSPSVDGIARGLTIAAWLFRNANTGAALQTVVSRQEGPTNEEIYALFVRRDGRLVFSLAATTLEPQTPLPAGQWVHLAATYDGSRARVYINGAEVGARDLNEDFLPDSEPLVIGGNLNGPQDPSVLSWEGRLDEVAFYNRGLDVAEVKALAR